MKVPLHDAIDCDLHPAMPGVPALLPYLDEFWADQLANRHIDRLAFTLSSYPPSSPLSARPDWRVATGAPAADLGAIRRNVLDRFGVGCAICNPLHGALALFNDDMTAALCSAVNDWMARELLDHEPRLRASILVPGQSPDLAVREIERVAPDRRFVQVLLLAMGETPLGRRAHWPIYAAAEKHQLAIGIHAGSTYRVAPTYSGWTSYRVEDYVAQSAAFETQLLSLVAEGVFQKFPAAKGGADQVWASPGSRPGFGARARPGAGCAPRCPGSTGRQRRLFASTCASRCSPSMHRGPSRRYCCVRWSTWARTGCCCSRPTIPHWQFDADDVLPDGLPEDTIRKILRDNPRDTYPRLGAAPALGEGPGTGEKEAT